MPSRRELTDALTKPLNVLVPAAVVVAAALSGAAWLVAVALVSWLVLAAMTLRDAPEAPRLGDRPKLAAPIASRLDAAMDARAAIRSAVAESRSPLDDVTGEVDALALALQTHAVRAQRIHEFLAGEGALDADSAALARVRQRLYGLLAEMDQIVGALRTVQAEILASDGIEEAALASQVFDLRARVQTTSEGLEEAFAETRARV